MNLENKTNEELMIIYRDESPELAYQAFGELYKRSSGPLYSFLLKKTKNKEESEDLLQKTYIKIHQSQKLYDPKYKFEQWLFTIARNLTMDGFRKMDGENKKLNNYFKTANVEILEEDTIQTTNLVNEERELLEMKFVDELTYQEISLVLNKSEVSLRKMVSRIIKRLRQGES